MENLEVKNAIIESTTIDMGDRNLLTAWVHLDYGGSGQGFGGFVLYLPSSYKHHGDPTNYAGHFIYRCMQVAGVSNWEQLKGKAIRVEGTNGRIVRIGHITKDVWFEPSKEFEQMRVKAKEFYTKEPAE